MVVFSSKNRYSSISDLFSTVFDEIIESSNKINKRPSYDIIENDNEYIIEVSLAGMKKENINIEVDKDNLIIKAKREENKELNYNRKETYFGDFEKTFKLPDSIDNKNIISSFIDGILKITIPKIINPNTKKKIEINQY